MHIREKINDTQLYTFIELLKTTHSQQKVCKILGVAKSTYYANLKKKPSKTKTRRNEFLIEIKRIHVESKEIYGAPKIHALLQKQNKICSLKYVQKIMKANGIKFKILKKYRPRLYQRW